MTWPQYVLIAWFIYAALTVVASVGKPREPIAPDVAAVSLIITVGLVWLVVLA